MPSPCGDPELVTRSRAGDVAAFGELLVRHQSLVCALTCSATGDRTLGEDLAQDTFLTAWRSLATLREPARFRAWLCTIARNLATNARRDRKDEIPLESLEAPDGAIDLADALASAENEELVWAALARLPDTVREPLVLYYREERSVAEVAELLDLTTAAVERRLSRGRKALKVAVEQAVERTLARARPSDKLRAGVLAAIGVPGEASETGRASAATGGTMAMLMKVVLAAGVLVGSGVLVAIAAERNGSDDAIEAQSSDHAHAADASAGDDDSLDADALARARSEAAHARAQAESPVRYMLTEVSETSVAVALAGGPSSILSPRDAFSAYKDEKGPVELHGDNLQVAAAIAKIEAEPVPPVVREIEGRVLDQAGHPIEGAIVVASAKLHSTFGSLVGEAGATTGADGRFRLALRQPGPTGAIALHDHAGWSAPTPIAPDAREVELRLARPARIDGTVVRAGEPEAAELRFAREGGPALLLSVESDAGGRWTMQALPPGTWTIAASPAREIGGGIGRKGKASVELTAGERRSIELVVPVGSLVAVEAKIPTGIAHHTAEYTLLAGRHAPPDHDALRALEQDPELLAGRMLFGGENLHDVMQFHDIEAGPATVCVELAAQHEPVAFGCKEIDVPEAGKVLEVEVTPTIVR